ncbi:MAG: amidohydrolase [Oscillospiraceae bacterium]|nr:amidohydrolase [Oscillospiraceae bacterium]
MERACQFLKEAINLRPELKKIRRELHRHPEVGFDLTFTKAFVKEQLEKLGYTPVEMGRAGLVAVCGGKKPGKTILLRADMDALPIYEEADIDYRSETEGRMHGCGHDMHTAMLLGAAKLLKAHESEIQGTVKLEFQPAEEIFQGSPDMISAGVLEDPHVDAAVMIHVTAGLPLPSGTVMVAGGGISTASCEQYHITVQGKGGHGSVPHETIDPITAAAHIHLALQEINSREIDGHDYGVFTTGRFEAGQTSNVIPDKAEMWGTIRTTDPDNKVGELIKKRIEEIGKGVGMALRCEVTTEFYDFCPCMVIDEELSNAVLSCMKEMFDSHAISLSEISGGKPGGGSEDFAFVSHEVPTVSIFLVAGSINDGYIYGQHHPKVRFDDSVLHCGAAAYAYSALRWLEQHN